METIVFLERDSVQAEFRSPSFAHTWQDHASTRPEEIAERLAGASIAVVNKAPLSAEVLSRLPDLKLIALAATGSDNVELDFCRERGLAVCNVRGYAPHSVAEHVLMLMLALRRQLLPHRQAVQAGEWAAGSNFCHFAAPIHDLAGSTLGIVGHGAHGQAVARLASAFGMSVLIAERPGKPLRPGRHPFETVLAASDVLSLHCPLTPTTRHLIDARALGAMKPSALLINTARGALVDEVALADALAHGRLGGAGIDVLSVEPPPAHHPLTTLDLPNLLVTPHVAWASREAMQTLADQLVDNLEAFMRGESENRLV